jgi:hypothetical protein
MCKHAGMLNENCPYAEIWVTSNNKDDQAVQAAAAAGGEVAAAATPKTKTTTDFVLTNGERPYVLTSSGAKYYQPMLEIVGAKIEFVGQPLCWYLDSSFCAVRPHALATSPVRYALTHPSLPLSLLSLSLSLSLPVMTIAVLVVCRVPAQLGVP